MPTAIVVGFADFEDVYPAWEKGSVENANQLMRRWDPKETDFSRASERRIEALEGAINSIHRKRLGGKTAHAAYLASA